MKLDKVDCGNCNLDDESAAEICGGAQVNTTLNTLRLHNNRLFKEGGQHLAAMLKENATMKQLLCGSNLIEDSGALVIFQILAEVNKTLENIDLFQCPTTETGEGPMVPLVVQNRILKQINAIRLENESAVDISERKHRMTLYEAAFLQDRLVPNTSVKALNLRHSSITPRCCEVVCKDWPEKNRTVNSLDITDNNVGDVGAKLMGKILDTDPSITTLHMLQNQVSRSAEKELCARVRGNKTLDRLNYEIKVSDAKALDLSSTNETYGKYRKDRAMEVYEAAFIAHRSDPANFPKNALETLNVGHCQVDDDCAKEFKDGLDKNRTLKSLLMRKNNLKDPGAISVSNIVEANPTVTKLDLSDNIVKDEGGLKVFDTLTKNTTLIDLDILDQRDGGISRKGEKQMADKVEKNTTLVTLNRDIILKDKTTLDLSKRGRRLTLYEASFIGHRLKILRGMQDVDLANNKVDNEAVTYIATGAPVAKDLNRWNLDHNELKEDGAATVSAAIAKAVSVKILGLADNSIADQGGFALAKMVAENTTLTDLSLHDATHGSTDTNQFADEGKAAESFQPAFAKNKTLRILNRMNVDQTALKPTRGDIHLYETHYLGAKLDGDTKVQDLGMGKQNLTDRCCEVLMAGVKKNKTVSKLDASSNTFAEKGGHSIADMLTGNSKVETFDIRDSNLEKSDSGACRGISDAFKSNKTVSTFNSLHLLQPKCDYSGFKGGFFLFDQAFIGTRLVLPFCKCQNLVINSCGVNDAGSTYIFPNVGANKTLNALSLQKNEFGDRSCSTLADALHNNTTLATLNIRFNESLGSYTDSAFIKLFKAKQIVTTFNDLSLLQARVTIPKHELELRDQGFIGIRLQQSRTVESLAFSSGTTLTDQGMPYIGDGIGACPSITSLDIQKSDLEASCGSVFGKAYQTNGSLYDVKMSQDDNLNHRTMCAALGPACNSIQYVNGIGSQKDGCLKLGGRALVKYENHFVEGVLCRSDCNCGKLHVTNANNLDDTWGHMCNGLNQRGSTSINLAMSKCHLDTDKLARILQSAQGCVGTLDIGGNGLGDDGCHTLVARHRGAALMAAAGCEEVFYDNNGIDQTACAILVDGVTSTLNRLSLKGIGAVGDWKTVQTGFRTHEDKKTDYKYHERNENKTNAEGQSYTEEGYITETLVYKRDKYTKEMQEQYRLRPEYRALKNQCERCNCQLDPNKSDEDKKAYDSKELDKNEGLSSTPGYGAYGSPSSSMSGRKRGRCP